MAEPHALTSARLALADARFRCQQAREGEKLARAQAEITITAEAGGAKALGANEAERERVLLVKLAAHTGYQSAVADVRRAERALSYAEIDLENLLDQRRAEEWTIRAKLADALAGRDTTPAALEDGAFEYALDATWPNDPADYPF